MKKLIPIFAVLVVTFSLTMGQSPESMSYQAIIRDANNTLIVNQQVAVRITILQGNMNGNAVYTETHTDSTNSNGLVSLEIGMGTTSDNFANIDWSNGPYFLKTESDPNGGTNYTITGTSQLLSVPYSLHAKTADSLVGGVTIRETDPVFSTSIAFGITAVDTSNWNDHTIDTDTQLDSTGIASLGYVAGPHTIDTNTQLDSTDIANLAYVAGPHTDSATIASMGFSAGSIENAGLVDSDGGTGNGSSVDMLTITLDLTGKEGKWIHIFGGTAISEDANTSNTSILRIIIDNNIGSSDTVCAQRQGIGVYSSGATWDSNSTSSLSVQGYFKVPNSYAKPNVTFKLNGGINGGNFHWGDQGIYTNFDGEGAGGHLGYAIF